MAAQLAALDAQRDEALAAKAHPAGRTGIEGWLPTLPATEQRGARANWNSILERAAKAKLGNEANGKLIALRMQQNQQTLGVLLGEPADASIYGADGQRSNKAGRRTLGSA